MTMMSLAVLLLCCGLTASQSVTCGRPSVRPASKRIVGGREARPGSWPWMVMIMDDLNQISGSGAILGPKTILTSAQHFEGMTFNLSTKHVDQWRLFVGAHSVSSSDPLQSKYHIQSVKVHEQYNATSILNDVALIFTQETIAFNDHASPVCLPDSRHRYYQGQYCYLAGWGNTAGTGNKDVLNQMSLPILADQTCLNHWWDFLSATEICAGYENGGKDFCDRDLGSPLVCKHAQNGVWYAQGIGSSGGDCKQANTPGIFEDVYVHVDWIKRTMATAGFPYQY